MNKTCEVITVIAAIAFFLALCSIETLSAGVLITMAISGAWLVGVAVAEEDKRQERKGR